VSSDIINTIVVKDRFDSQSFVKKNQHINLPLLSKPGKPKVDETALAYIPAYSSANKVIKIIANSFLWKELSW